MAWFKPSPFEQMVALMREERVQQAEVQKAQLTAMSQILAVSEKQGEFLKEWLKLFSSPQVPEVRIMTDVNEALRERLHPVDIADAVTPDSFDPEAWMADINRTFTELKSHV